MNGKQKNIRNLHLILGDQLDEKSAVLDGFDKTQDRVWMAEAAEEATPQTRSRDASCG